MLSREAAQEIAQKQVDEYARSAGEDYVLQREYVETDIAYAFFYDTRAYVENGDEGAHLYGNGPLIVMKSDGSLHVAGTRLPVEHYLANLAAYGTVFPPGGPFA